MIYYAVKVMVTALIIVAFTELSKKSSFWAAVLISLPLTSILALSWTYFEQRNAAQVIQLSKDILILVIPSLLFFVVLPLMLKANINFVISMLTACAVTGVAYYAMAYVMKKSGLN